MTKTEFGKIVKIEQFNGLSEQINNFSIAVLPSMLIDQFSDPDDEENWSEEQYRITVIGGKKTKIQVGDWIGIDNNGNCICVLKDSFLNRMVYINSLDLEKLPAVIGLKDQRLALYNEYIRCANETLTENNLPTEKTYDEAKFAIEENNLEGQLYVEGYEFTSDFYDELVTVGCELYTARKVFEEILLTEQ